MIIDIVLLDLSIISMNISMVRNFVNKKHNFVIYAVTKTDGTVLLVTSQLAKSSTHGLKQG